MTKIVQISLVSKEEIFFQYNVFSEKTISGNDKVFRKMFLDTNICSHNSRDTILDEERDINQIR